MLSSGSDGGSDDDDADAADPDSVQTKIINFRVRERERAMVNGERALHGV